MRLRPVWGVFFACALLGAPLALAQQPATGEPAGAGTAPTTGAPAAGAPAPAAGAPAAGAQPSTTAASPTEAVPPPSGTPAEAGGYTVRLRHLERSVSELKEQVFRTKARLQLLKETVLGGVIGASRAVIRHRNEMGATFRLTKVVYALDGVQIFAKADDTGRMSEMQEFDIYNGAIQPGSHTLTVNLVYQGHGFGVFSYMNNMKFNVRSSNTFVASEGRATQVTVVGYEKGGMTTNMDEKPAVDFRVNVMAGEGAPSAGKK
jgi:hypothetical protein